MKYDIYCDGKILVSYMYKSDRDKCLKSLQDKQKNSRFSTEEEKDES